MHLLTPTLTPLLTQSLSSYVYIVSVYIPSYSTPPDPSALRTNSALAATASTMQLRFRDLLKQQGHVCGTADMPLGLFTLQWFEEKGRYR